MKKITKRHVQNKLARYLTGKITIGVFRNWFIPASWDVSRTGKLDIQELVFKIESLLMEFENGDRTEAELQKQFAKVLESSVMQYGHH